MNPTGTTSQAGFDTAALVRAIEGRDASGIAALYAPDATITIVDRDHPPAEPWVLSGAGDIEGYFADICGRNIDHRIERLVADRDGVGFEQHCRYPEGNQVVCLTVATVADGLIRRQTIAQAWD